jgi:hypothetical protein
MANTVKLKRSAVPLRVPTTTDLDLGEIAINTFDGKAYIKQDVLGVETIVQLGGGGGSGDVTGAASSTDNAITRFDGTTGKIIQNSVATLSDTGVLTTLGATLDYMQIDTTATETIALGKTRWNADTATQAFGIIDGTIECNIGEQMYAYVVNAEATTITAGQAVYLYQATGNKASVKLAYNTGDATSAKTLGLVVADIAAGATGFVITQGVVGKLNTSAFAEGTTLYLGATAGSLTATKPYAPNHLVYIGVVERANAGNGQIYVRPQNGYELDEIHDVQIISPANGQTIIYDASTSLWKNANITAGTGISVTNGASSITVANSGVLGVTATSPVASSGGQNPVISMPAATTSVSGYLTSTDWNTFNGKQAALVSGTNIKTVNGTTLLGSGNLAVGTVTSVTGTAPVVSSGGATPAISMAAATTSVNGYLTSTDWNTFNGKQAALGFTPYNATNPSNYIALASAITGYTVGANTALAATDTLLAGLGKIQGQINARGTGNGTVTSVSGTGGYGGLTLSGTVTSSGNITLGGTPTGTWPVSVSGTANSETLATVTSRGSVATQFLNVPAGDGNGFCFWNDTTNYKISMGVGSLYQYGTVTDYSIKMQMDAGSTGRGFTWGRAGITPVAGINSTSGNFQTAGTIAAAGTITAYYSDERLKTKLGKIDNALSKVESLDGFYYEANEVAQALGYEVKREVGVSAQQVQKILPEIIAPAPIDNQYLTVHYERLVPLLIEAIKELKAEIDQLKTKA